MNTAIIITLIICATIVVLSVLNTIDKAIDKKQRVEREELKEAKRILEEVKELEDK